MGAHALLAPSASDRWLNCPGSVRLNLDFKDESSIFAREGTAAHKLCERGLKAHVTDITQMPLEKEIDGFEITEEMIESVNIYLETIYADIGKKGYKELKVESQFKLTDHIWGTVDASYVNGEKCFIYDFKYGKGVVVDPENNSQLMIYALGALKNRRKIKEAELVIVQPRAYSPHGYVRRVNYTIEAMRVFKDVVIQGEARVVGKPDAELKVGAHCKWCKAKAICPAQKQLALNVMKTKDFKKLPCPKTLSLEELGEAVVKGKMVSDWISAASTYAFSLAEKGEKIPGCKLVEKQSNRKWGDKEKAEKYLIGELKEEAFEKKILSPAKAEKALKIIHKLLDNTLVVKPSTGLTLVPQDNKRKEVLVKSTMRRFLETDKIFN